MTRYRIFFAIVLMLASRPTLGQVGTTLPADQADPTGRSRVIIIETSESADASEVIDKIVKALSQDGTIRTQSAADPLAQQDRQDEIEIELLLRRDTSTGNVIQLIKGLSSLEVQPVRVKFAPNEASANGVRIRTGRDVSAESLQPLVLYLLHTRMAPSVSLMTPVGRLQQPPPAVVANVNVGDPVNVRGWWRRYADGPDQSMEALRETRQQLEKTTRELATKIRTAKLDSPEVARQRADLRAAVQKAFAARQQLQRAELAEFARRVQRIGESLESRERIAAQIVDKRVTELLHPDSKWEVEIIRAETDAQPGYIRNAPTLNSPFQRNSTSTSDEKAKPKQEAVTSPFGAGDPYSEDAFGGNPFVR